MTETARSVASKASRKWGQALLSIKRSSRQTFRDVSETSWAQVTGQAWSFPQENNPPDAGGTGQALMARIGGAQGNPAQRALQASERANPDGGGDATADRPGAD